MDSQTPTAEQQKPQSIEIKTEKKGFNWVLILLTLLIVVVAGGLVYYFVLPKNKIITSLPSPEKIMTTPTPTLLPNLKTYTNAKYGFELNIPIKGITQKGTVFSEVDCGSSVKETSDGILVDNLIKIQVIPWTKTINDYLVQKGAKNIYEIETIENSGASEAARVVGLKKGLEVASIGYPPLMNIPYIYKNGDNLFVVKYFDNASNAGCINPRDLNPMKFAKYYNEPWDFAKNFTFSQ